ncbi:MAG TPA: alanine racemase [Thermodesulfobacteriota bacterium]|nr:alanine racemase [Thermodesulfobacteriota bacterium]
MGKRPTEAIIDMQALKHNYKEIRKRVSRSTKIMAVVKANAYGHGDREISMTLEKLGCRFFGVAFAFEGAGLRKAGIKSPIVVLGGINREDIMDTFRYELTPVVFDASTAALLNGHAKKLGKIKPVHVKIDSGMGRLGLLPEEASSFFREFKGFKNLKLEGLLSHFADADSEENGYSGKQLAVFIGAVKKIRAMGYNPPYLHMANSAATIGCKKAHFNLVRIGVMLYGAYPAPHFKGRIKLKPVMKLKTRILYLKKVPAGFSVSYGRRFVTQKESVIATLPIGYGDGLPRRFSGNGEMLVRGKRAPVSGTICMDHTMLDVTDIKGVDAGDEVVVIGRQNGDSITADEIAEKTNTIPYEILCNISLRVPRLFL